MKNYSRIFYFCAINTKEYEQKINQHLHVGAATSKVLSVVAALRSVGYRAYPVSLPVLGRLSTNHFVNTKFISSQGSLIIFLRTLANPFLRRLIGMIDFGIFCWRIVKSSDRVIFYNYMPEYLFALFILKLKNNPAILDVEDAPRIDEQGFRGFLNRLMFPIFLALCKKRYLCVSLEIVNNFRLRSACVIYGVAKKIDNKSSPEPNKNYLRILYGGTLCNDTGLQLFCDSVKLIKKHINCDKKLIFVVTGFGGDEKINELMVSYNDDQFLIEKKIDLSADEYQNELLSCDAALCLKMPDSEMGATTFPSKVVEITASGLLLISTKVSDIPLLFDTNSAVLLPEATPRALADAILSVLANPLEMRKIAHQGQQKAIELFESKRVGTRIVDFILNDIV